MPLWCAVQGVRLALAVDELGREGGAAGAMTRRRHLRLAVAQPGRLSKPSDCRCYGEAVEPGQFGF